VISSGFTSTSVASSHEHVVELGEHGADRTDHVAGDAGLEGQAASVEVLEPEQRVHVQHPHGLGIGLGDLLHVHAAHARQHHHRLLGRAVEHDRGVVLLVDLRRLLHVQLVHGVAADVHAEDRRGVLLRLVAIVRQLDAAGLAAAADLDLRLDDHREA
jgi:hypothetical protein